MKKLAILTALLLTGCLNTQTKHIVMKSHPTGVSSVNSGVVVDVNPKNSDEQDVEYFQSHSLRWPDTLPDRSPAPTIEKEATEPY
jgi:uncharacterized lipoprotein YajG